MDEPTCLAARECFITLGFYHLRFRHRLLIPQDAHITPDVYSARTLALRTHFLQNTDNKKPRSF
jgi:hypothetical protein